MNWNQLKVSWNQWESIESKLKTNWKWFEMKLKSIENQLKVNWNQLKSIECDLKSTWKSIARKLKSIETYIFQNFTLFRPVRLKISTLKRLLELFGGVPLH